MNRLEKIKLRDRRDEEQGWKSNCISDRHWLLAELELANENTVNGLQRVAELETEVEQLRETLEFYAKPGNYVEIQDLSQEWPNQIIRPAVIEDAGETARRALGKEE